MIEFLIRRFVPDWQQVQRTDVRERYGTLAAAVGILSNIFLCIIKGLIGLFSGSIAVTADAVNNLSDAGSSVITLLAFKIAGKPADEEHPYGHARMEYISGMAVSFIIILLGLELMGSSFEKILHPEEVGVSALTYLVLIVSIAVKLWQGMFNRTGHRCRQLKRRLFHRRGAAEHAGLPVHHHPHRRLGRYAGRHFHHHLGRQTHHGNRQPAAGPSA